MTTSDGAPEVWRVECEGGEAREVPVRSRAVLLGGRVQTLYEAGEGDASVERLTARAAVVGLASFEGWPVVAVLAPGQPTCAEVDAAHVRAANARDQLRLRCEELEAERDALRSLLAAAARGELPRCDECPHAATLYAATTAGEFHRCDAPGSLAWAAEEEARLRATFTKGRRYLTIIERASRPMLPGLDVDPEGVVLPCSCTDRRPPRWRCICGTHRNRFERGHTLLCTLARDEARRDA